mmetsp:Transcript_17497/g.56325  ORF Transcript_17497/g.56325 Transcript_17497/m.56325 type:complete len:144 (-) Transcript_17497:696-1127(-)
MHYSAPIVSKTQEMAPRILSGVDATVDSTMLAAHGKVSAYKDAATGMFEKQKELQSDNIQHFTNMREEYLKKIEEAVAYVKDKGVSEPILAAAAQVTAAVSEARAGVLALDRKAMAEKVTTAWSAFVALPAVAGILAQVSCIL